MIYRVIISCLSFAHEDNVDSMFEMCQRFMFDNSPASKLNNEEIKLGGDIP